VACNPRWESGRSNQIILEEEDPTTFALFLAWVQTSRIESAECFIEVSIDRIPFETSSNIGSQWTQLCACFVSGDYLQAYDFKNCVMDLLVLNCRMQHYFLGLRAGTDPKDLSYIYQKTNRGSPLRQLVIDIVVTSPAHPIPNYQNHSILSQYLVELASYAINEAKESRLTGKPCSFRVPWKNDPCRYHTHPYHPVSYSCTRPDAEPYPRHEILPATNGFLND
jgi:hypothetical protein